MNMLDAGKIQHQGTTQTRTEIIMIFKSKIMGKEHDTSSNGLYDLICTITITITITLRQGRL